MQIESIVKSGVAIDVTVTNGENSTSFYVVDWALFKTGLLRNIRECERDLAFLAHGDDWRSHIKPKNFWTDPPDAEEAALIEQIRKAADADAN